MSCRPLRLFVQLNPLLDSGEFAAEPSGVPVRPRQEQRRRNRDPSLTALLLVRNRAYHSVERIVVIRFLALWEVLR